MPLPYRDLETYQATVRRGLPEVAITWLAAVRVEMEALTRAALDPATSEEDFRALIHHTSQRLPELYRRMNHAALARALEDAMGGAMANGLAHTLAQLPARPLRAQDGKPCGKSWISQDKECHKGEGITHQWQPVTPTQATAVQNITGLPFKTGAQIVAMETGITHANRNHAHQLTAKDWKQLGGRLFDPRTEKQFSTSRRGEKVIIFTFPRNEDLMQAVFIVRQARPNRRFPGELQLKTYKQLTGNELIRYLKDKK